MNQHLHSREPAAAANVSARSVEHQGAIAAIRSILRSRARWRDMLHNAVDLVFEADAQGALVTLAPETWLGWNAPDLIGQQADILWQGGPTIASGTTLHREPVVAQDRSGRQKHILVSVYARQTRDGTIEGYSGSIVALPQDTKESQQPAVGETHPRADGTVSVPSLAPVIKAIRSAVLPVLAVSRATEVLGPLLGCRAIVLSDRSLETLDASADPGPLQPRASDNPPPDVIQQVITQELGTSSSPVRHILREKQQILVVQERLRSRGRLALLCWRETPWQEPDVELLTSSCQILASHLELDGIHRRILENAPFDISSGLLNWRGLRDQIIRRTSRLDQQHMAATLMVLRVNGLSDIIKTHGFMGDEEACRQTVELLSRAVRPSDPIARLGRNIFAFWLDGGDRFAAAERAERITAHGVPIILSPALHLSVHIGLVSREPGMTETPEILLERAVEALNGVPAHSKLWRFSCEAP